MDEADGECRCEMPPATTTAAVWRQRQSTKNNGAGDAIMDEAEGEYRCETPPATTTAGLYDATSNQPRTAAQATLTEAQQNRPYRTTFNASALG
jgi:hypothetical protein